MFVKGKSGNPAGRKPKGQAFSDILRRELERKVDGVTRAEKITDKLLSMAERGDPAAIKYVMDRIEGSPRQSIDLEEKSDIVIRLEFDTEGI